MQSDSAMTVRILGLLAALALGVGCLLVLRPFLSALLWAAILVYSTWPAFRMLRERLRLSPGMAALAMVLAEFLLIGLPLVFATPTKREDVEGLRAAVEGFLTQGLPGLGDWLGRLPLIGHILAEHLSGIDLGLSGIADLIAPYAGTLAQAALGVLLAVLSGLAEVLLAIFLAFFLYRDGPAIAQRAEAALSRLAGERTRHIVEVVGGVTRGVVYGLLGTAIAQGLMTWFGLWLAGVPRPTLLGVIAGCISILPVGAPLVWIPATIWLFAQGQTGWAIFLGLYGAFGISSADNVIRPWLIARGADLPLLLTLLGALGGVFAFGFLGLFLGPVLLAVGFTLLKDWADGARAPAKPGG
ncbi:AI-2E family transporter [Paracraurococcus ruber]|uniref:AI-2E family transporter n=1 Tax=Paracraurococcus ruber TaxID=77675 RepID=A0ABS1CUL0_9PROT|nr:AI-2E family transporter [Paracraurococcus ruber]MBK1658167.1 AI-2E family transporter [Paracraurococcus ruber]TDG31797.1 AI-2E family transporter [Paracraurococcus ruber]